jgi:hypothetical protein
MNETIVRLPNGDFTTKKYLEGNAVIEIITVTVHEFSIGDAEDPDLYAAEPLIKWENSEEGQWITAHALETPIWQRQIDHTLMGYRYKILAKLKDKDFTFWSLKYRKLS